MLTLAPVLSLLVYIPKDGAAKLQQHNTLISIVGDQNRDSMIRDWDNLLK